MKTLQKITGLAVFLAFIINVFSPVTALAEGLAVEISSPANGGVFMVGESINFSAGASGGDGFYAYTWNFGDGSDAFGENYSKSYDEAGSYTITLSVIDSSDNTGSTSINLTIEDETPEEPVMLGVEIESPANNASLTIGQATTFSAGANGGTGLYAYTWNFGDGSDAFGESYEKTYSTTGIYTVTLSVIDSEENHGSAQIQVSVGPGGNGENQAPSIDLKINGDINSATITAGNTATLSWTSINTNSCIASGSWFGPKEIIGSESVGSNLAEGVYTFSLSCVGVSTPVVDSVNLIVGAPSNGGGNEDGDLEVSNIRVTDVTQASAIVRWNTNLAASSRVVYDTTSHANLGEAPNYGYANSTETTDTGTGVTEHAVTLTGLSAATTYYFRVISER